jgi:hypothetical protein
MEDGRRVKAINEFICSQALQPRCQVIDPNEEVGGLRTTQMTKARMTKSRLYRRAGVRKRPGNKEMFKETVISTRVSSTPSDPRGLMSKVMLVSLG